MKWMRKRVCSIVLCFLLVLLLCGCEPYIALRQNEVDKLVVETIDIVQNSDEWQLNFGIATEEKSMMRDVQNQMWYMKAGAISRFYLEGFLYEKDASISQKVKYPAAFDKSIFTDEIAPYVVLVKDHVRLEKIVSASGSASLDSDYVGITLTFGKESEIYMLLCLVLRESY